MKRKQQFQKIQNFERFDIYDTLKYIYIILIYESIEWRELHSKHHSIRIAYLNKILLTF